MKVTRIDVEPSFTVDITAEERRYLATVTGDASKMAGYTSAAQKFFEKLHNALLEVA